MTTNSSVSRHAQYSAGVLSQPSFGSVKEERDLVGLAFNRIARYGGFSLAVVHGVEPSPGG